MPTRQCERCERNRSERFYSGPRGRVCSDCLRESRRRASKARSLKERYDITLEEFEALKDAQRDDSGQIRCRGCNETRSQNYAWSVDHDHAIEATQGVRASIRGLLCRRCNKVLRDVRDNWMTLSILSSYVLHGRLITQQILAAGADPRPVGYPVSTYVCSRPCSHLGLASGVRPWAFQAWVGCISHIRSKRGLPRKLR